MLSRARLLLLDARLAARPRSGRGVFARTMLDRASGLLNYMFP